MKLYVDEVIPSKPFRPTKSLKMNPNLRPECSKCRGKDSCKYCDSIGLEPIKQIVVTKKKISKGFF
jgi:hypothetical protein